MSNTEMHAVLPEALKTAEESIVMFKDMIKKMHAAGMSREVIIGTLCDETLHHTLFHGMRIDVICLYLATALYELTIKQQTVDERAFSA